MEIIEENYDWAYPLTARRATEELIVHHAAAERASPEDVHRWHQARGWAGMAYHYYVRKDGSVHRGRPETAVGGHTEDHNYNSIGICFEGDFEQETMGAAQLAAGMELLEDIRCRYPDIPVRRHSDFGPTACPGKNFPFEEMTEEMTQEKFNAMAQQWMAELARQEPSDWSAPAREWAEKTGLLRGDENGGMQYKKPMTREEFVTLEYRRAMADEKE